MNSKILAIVTMLAVVGLWSNTSIASDDEYDHDRRYKKHYDDEYDHDRRYKKHYDDEYDHDRRYKKHYNHDGRMGGHGFNLSALALRYDDELNLTDTQEYEIKSIASASRKQMRDLMRSMKKKDRSKYKDIDKFADIVEGSSLTIEQLESLSADYGKMAEHRKSVMSDMRTIINKASVKTHAILTAEQRKKLSDIIRSKRSR